MRTLVGDINNLLAEMDKTIEADKFTTKTQKQQFVDARTLLSESKSAMNVLVRSHRQLHDAYREAVKAGGFSADPRYDSDFFLRRVLKTE